MQRAGQSEEVWAFSTQRAERNLLIKVTRFTQLLQMSKDFLSQKKSLEEGRVLQPPPGSPGLHLLRCRQIHQDNPQPQLLEPGRGGSTHHSRGREEGDKTPLRPRAVHVQGEARGPGARPVPPGRREEGGKGNQEGGG